MSRPVLVAENVQMTFPAEAPPASAPWRAAGPANNQGVPLEALEQASFALYENEFVSIIGPSGCGKSTLLRILAGLVRPTAGRVLLDGQEVREPQPGMGLVFQHANLMPWRTALANVLLPLEVLGVSREEADTRAREVLELVGLSDFGAALPRELSGGMQQRVALARALVYDPEVLLLDEPFGALDALTRERMNWELLRIWQRRRKTVLMVTHNIQEAVFLSDRVLIMSSRPGRIREEVAIDIPRPRQPDDLYQPRFLDLARTLRQALEDSHLGNGACAPPSTTWDAPPAH